MKKVYNLLKISVQDSFFSPLYKNFEQTSKIIHKFQIILPLKQKNQIKLILVYNNTALKFISPYRFQVLCLRNYKTYIFLNTFSKIRVQRDDKTRKNTSKCLVFFKSQHSCSGIHFFYNQAFRYFIVFFFIFFMLQ